MGEHSKKLLLSATWVIVFSTLVFGQESSNSEDLQKATQNPVASLISVPFQNKPRLALTS